jgi:hypothetical protein
MAAGGPRRRASESRPCGPGSSPAPVSHFPGQAWLLSPALADGLGGYAWHVHHAILASRPATFAERAASESPRPNRRVRVAATSDSDAV